MRARRPRRGPPRTSVRAVWRRGWVTHRTLLSSSPSPSPLRLWASHSAGESRLCSPPHPTVLGAQDPPPTEAEAHSQNPEEKQPGGNSAADTGDLGLLRPALTGARRQEPTGSPLGNNVGCVPTEAERSERLCTEVSRQL